jgi:hypothetical protein
MRCRRAPIPGGSVCKFHGGGSRAARAAGQRRLAEAAIRSELAEWARSQVARKQAFAPWEQEPALYLPGYAQPKDLRRIAREMSSGARLLRETAKALERAESSGSP